MCEPHIWAARWVTVGLSVALLAVITLEVMG